MYLCVMYICVRTCTFCGCNSWKVNLLNFCVCACCEAFKIFGFAASILSSFGICWLDLFLVMFPLPYTAALYAYMMYTFCVYIKSCPLMALIAQFVIHMYVPFFSGCSYWPVCWWVCGDLSSSLPCWFQPRIQLCWSSKLFISWLGE